MIIRDKGVQSEPVNLTGLNAQNETFFGVSVGNAVTIGRDMGKGSFMDLGIAMMTSSLAPESECLGATGIGALANFDIIVHEHVDIAERYPSGPVAVFCIEWLAP